MKSIYLVRHGESIANTADTFLSDDAGLTTKGATQARFIAERAANLPITAIIASPWGRTRETAEAIARRINLPITYSDLFVERQRPSSLRGKHKTDPAVAALNLSWVRSTEGRGERVEDGEDIEMLSERAAACLEFLESHPADNILVVSHGYFARVLMARMLFGTALSREVFAPLSNGFRSTYTGLSVFRFDPADARGNPWHVRTWNDHAHLG